jgi:transcriptional regulator with XRE-family HTH domain
VARQADRPGTCLAGARKRKRLTLRAVQEAVGTSNAYLSQLETGKVQSPSPILKIDLISEVAVKASEIEGKILNQDSVQSSQRAQLGLGAGSP